MEDLAYSKFEVTDTDGALDYLNVSFDVLDTLVATRQVVVVQKNGKLFFPTFQFDYANHCLLPGLTTVNEVLNSIFSSAEVALWWATPVDKVSPVTELMSGDVDTIVEWARRSVYAAL